MVCRLELGFLQLLVTARMCLISLLQSKDVLEDGHQVDVSAFVQYQNQIDEIAQEYVGI